MMLPETSGLVAVTSMVSEVFQDGDPQRGRKYHRAGQISQFSAQASALISMRGIRKPSVRSLENEATGAYRDYFEAATQPVEALVGGQRFHLRVVNTGDIRWYPGYLSTVHWMGIHASVADSQTDRPLFGVERFAMTPDGGRTRSQSRIRNYLGRIASDAEIARGLGVLDYIGDELALRPMWDSLNR